MMRVVYDPLHALHDPTTEVQYGVPIPMYERPIRAETIRRALETDGGFEFLEASEHGTEPITAVHERGLLSFLEEAWNLWRAQGGLMGGANQAPQLMPDTVLHPALREGMGPAREPTTPIGRIGYWCWETMTPIVPGSYRAARVAVDVGLTAADLILGGARAVYALTRPPGHHSPRAAFGGYCFFNVAAIATEYLVRSTGGTVAILDVDYHHGNGTQQIFYARGDVLYVSLHADPDRAYPYFAGWRDEVGTGPGQGATRNFPLPAGCSNQEYLETLEDALGTIAAFTPGVLVVSLGFDTYGQDPIGDFALSTDAYHRVGTRVAALDIPTLIIQEGGYFVPKLGENARQWLRGFEGRPLDLGPDASPPGHLKQSTA
jgi:acetoin utilization deacetylase AcuC-like enzyme